MAMFNASFSASGARIRPTPPASPTPPTTSTPTTDEPRTGRKKNWARRNWPYLAAMVLFDLLMWLIMAPSSPLVQ